MKLCKYALLFGLAGLTAASLPLTALADPEFARSAEEWARLRDNVLEYDEIVDLVHEYNASVRKNQVDLAQFRNEYGLTNTQWSNRYLEIAENVENNLEYPDVDDASYAAVMAGMVSSEMQIKNLREKADDALEDYEVTYYTYSAEECRTASQAQSDMISYYLNQIQLENDQKSLELTQITYDLTVQREALGTATAADVLRASENLRVAQKTVRDDESAIEEVRQKLLVSLGWSHDAEPEICGIPAVDMDFIASINPEADKEKAIENSYTLKADKKKLANASASDNIETLETTIAESEQKIGASLKASAQSVTAAKAAYDLSVAEAELEAKNLLTAERRHSLGEASNIDYLTQKNTAETARIAVETARLNLFKAVQEYQWMLNGLAGSGA